MRISDWSSDVCYSDLLAVGISGLLAFWLSRTPRSDWRTALPFALVVGGALGTVIDRIVHGHVIDFIQLYWRAHYWPAFHISHSAFVGGVVGLALFGFLPRMSQPHGQRHGRASCGERVFAYV